MTCRSFTYLVYNRELRTRFDLLKSNMAETAEQNQRAQVARPGRRELDLAAGNKVMLND